MIFELLSHRNNVSYNLKIASIFGVCSAIFLGLLIDNKNENLDNLVEGKYFMLNRQYIYLSTGLDDLKQLEVESNLKECGIIDVIPVKNNLEKFYYSLDEDLLVKFLTVDSIEETKKLLTPSAQKKTLISVPRTQAPSKRSQYILSLKKSIQEDDPILRECYCNWIDAVYANPKGFLSVSSIKQCIKTLKELTDNKSVQKEIIEIAIKNGSRNLDWAIEEYNKKPKQSNLHITKLESESVLQDNIEKIKHGAGPKF